MNNAGKWVCDPLTEDVDFGKKQIIFSDKVHFHLGGNVNKQNFRIWDTENPHAYIEKPTHTKRITVWCGFWSRGVIEPFFEAVTVNGDRYRAALNEFLLTRGTKRKKRRILTTFGFNRTALRATQPKLHSMF